MERLQISESNLSSKKEFDQVLKEWKGDCFKIILNRPKQYNALSFVAKGENRNFLLEPLFSFRDEPYTVYFNIQA